MRDFFAMLVAGVAIGAVLIFVAASTAALPAPNVGDGTAGRPACTGYTVWMYWSNGYRTWQCRWASAPGYYWAAL